MVETTEVEDNATNFEENTIPSKISTETTDVMEDGTNKAPIEILEAGNIATYDGCGSDLTFENDAGGVS